MNKEKIQKRLLFIPLLVMTSLLVGCASSKLNVLKPLDSQPNTVSLTLLDNTVTHVSDEDIGNFKAALSNSLINAGITVVSTERKNVPAIVGEIKEYNEGSRSLRYFVGFGAGKGSMKTAWKVIDSSRKEVASCSIDGSIASGVFGGSFYEVHDEVAKSFIIFFTSAKE